MNDSRQTFGGWVFATGIGVFALAAIVRVNNALRFETNWGFDASENWSYIARLREAWQLPTPDAFWSAYHPPLFYLVGGVTARLLEPFGEAFTVSGIRIVSSALGMLAIGVGVWMIRRVDPANSRRAVLAAALMLFLPVHLYMSAMLSAELMVASFTTLVVALLAADQAKAAPGATSLWHSLALGLLAGLACLTKLTGCLVVAVAVATIVSSGWRREAFLQGLTRAMVFSLAVLAAGGWFYARSLIVYGYLYPESLEVHEIMFSMPPGVRAWTDYLYLPLATWTDPQLLAPDLLRSVWGSTYVTMWFDGHRHFLARNDPALSAWGTGILTLALLPMTAFVVGAARGARRALRRLDGPDTPLLLLLVVTLAGYVLFSWRNPWFTTLKASFLLGLILPFGYYASEVLADWTRRPGFASACVFALLGALLLAVLIIFSYGLVFSNPGPLGLQWQPAAGP